MSRPGAPRRAAHRALRNALRHTLHRGAAPVAIAALAASGCAAPATPPGTAGSSPTVVDRTTVLDRAGDLQVAPRHEGRAWAALRAAGDVRRVDLVHDGSAEVLTVTVRTRGRVVAAPRGTRREVRVSLFGPDAITTLVGLPARGRVLVEPEDAELGPTTACEGGSVTTGGRRLVLTAPSACLGEPGARRTRTWLTLRARTGSVRLDDVTRLSQRLAPAAS